MLLEYYPFKNPNLTTFCQVCNLETAKCLKKNQSIQDFQYYIAFDTKNDVLIDLIDDNETLILFLMERKNTLIYHKIN